jgi:hypothetical protein
VRVYLPATVALLRRAVAEDRFSPVGGTGFAVTPGLRAEYPGADEEELEYLAMHDAALASLRLIAGSGDGPAIRVVLAADDRDAAERGDLDRAAVRLAGTVPWPAVAAVHLDGGDAVAAVRAAADAIDAADLGDPDAAVVVGDAEDIDLAWYAPDEIGYLLTELGPE